MWLCLNAVTVTVSCNPDIQGLATVRIHGEGPSMRLDEDMNDLSSLLVALPRN
ncbi:hypothetical protein M752DRAFT_274712 [Aspergillus phoenicis ATCC 13157]|uniref:Uncharacterized protein n=1 Tax=Aspergillus phoenicis ATCC 13157 TaxID=1353007 RepID=A0A370PQB3_ASPPH|nr:hypothetical protein M752DRAFT_274712 [Aspergillus phoenicis ATCC 13157]